MYLLVLFFPFMSFFLSGLFGFVIGSEGVCFFSTSMIGLAFLVSLFISYEVLLCGSTLIVQWFDWFNLGSVFQSINFLFDSLTSVMLVVILFISFLVHLYSTSYMEGDPHLSRFMTFLSLFTFFMLVFVTSGNFLQMFMGWEGVGLSSYLLVNFWFTRVQANKSSLKAVIVNRFGDVSLLFACFLCWLIFRSFDYFTIFPLVEYFNSYYFTFLTYKFHYLSVLSLFIFFGCVAKSAQLGLHTWLPDAMEGPTPVSALIHAATMVTAGVFLLIRCSPILECSSSILYFVTLVASMTIIFAGTSGLFQNDLKRVIAYSTCSQLGYMVLACGLSAYSIALFHLTTHAFFKALLFLSAGSVIHAVGDEQDIRRMGGLYRFLPLTYACFSIGSLALMGFPYTSGFYSKDSILEILAFSSISNEFFSIFLSVFGAIVTGLYSFKLLYFTFLAETNLTKSSIQRVSESSWAMYLPLLVLSVFSIFSGYFLKDLFIGPGVDSFSMGLRSGFDIYQFKSEFASSSLKFLPIFLSFLFSVLLILFYCCFPSFLNFFWISQFSFFFSKKWLIDVVYNTYVVFPSLRFGYNVVFKIIDRGVIEIFGPTGLVRNIPFLNIFISTLQSGYLFNYVFLLVLSTFFSLYNVVDTRLGAFFALFTLFYLLTNRSKNNSVINSNSNSNKFGRD